MTEFDINGNSKTVSRRSMLVHLHCLCKGGIFELQDHGRVVVNLKDKQGHIVFFMSDEPREFAWVQKHCIAGATARCGPSPYPFVTVERVSSSDMRAVLHLTEKEADEYAVKCAMENTSATKAEIREHLARGEHHAEGDYEIWSLRAHKN